MTASRQSQVGPSRGADDWIERVRAASDIVEVVGQTVKLRRSGRNWVGLCPFHEEKTPSFSVHAERQFFHCFSCKAGGDVFKFVQETEKLGFLEAAEVLSRRAGIPVPERRAGERPGTQIREALEAAATAYQQWLADPDAGAGARAYLEGRGIESRTVTEFRLGVAPPGWENLVQRLGRRFPDPLLVEAGLGARRESARGGLYDRFRNRLMVPLIAPGGAVVGFGARVLGPDEEPKYLNSPETPLYRKGSFLYALDAARRHVTADGEVVVVEGYFDALSLHQAGVRNVVATSGTALTAEQARLLSRSTSRVVLTYDGDRAGQEAMMRSLGTLLGEGLDVWVIELPGGEDPDSLVRRRGAAGWLEVRRAAADPLEFVQRHGLKAGGVGDPRERALQAVVRLATAIGDPIRLEMFLERASQVFGLPEATLRRAVSLKRGGQGAERPLQAALRERSRSLSHLERTVLQSLLHAPEALEQVREHLSPEDFADPGCAAVAHCLWSGQVPSTVEDAAPLARELMAGTLEDTDWTRVAEEGARALVQRRLEGQLKNAQQRLRELQRQGLGSDPETGRLLHHSQELARSIKALNR